MARYFQKKQCRICGNTRLVSVLDLGRQSPANNFLKKSEMNRKKPRFPLAVQFCENCSLLSLCHVVDPEILFVGYQYLTGASAPLVAHFVEEAKMIARKFIRDKSNLVVEFGSNDGTLLAELKDYCRVLGVDPARNVAARAKKRGVPTILAFFGERTAKHIQARHGHARVIVANNVFAHIDALHDVMRGIRTLLREDGVFISESHWVGNLIGEGGFDQIYHEHLSYYSLHALRTLAGVHGLIITDAELLPIHGASLRVTMRRAGTAGASVRQLLLHEEKIGLTRLATFERFAKRASANKAELRELFRELKRKQKTIAGYGAPAKGNTLLNYCGFGRRALAFITDTTPSKQGLLAPGTHIPIVPPAILKTELPDYLLLLAWNYADAILEKEKALRAKGVKFIIPVPRVRIV